MKGVEDVKADRQWSYRSRMRQRKKEKKDNELKTDVS